VTLSSGYNTFLGKAHIMRDLLTHVQDVPSIGRTGEPRASFDGPEAKW
jgi:hypothetical protein